MNRTAIALVAGAAFGVVIGVSASRPRARAAATTTGSAPVLVSPWIPAPSLHRSRRMAWADQAGQRWRERPPAGHPC